MSGETDQNQSSLTPDLVMRALQKQIDDLDRLQNQRFEDQQRLLDERYTTSVKALDAAFVAQQLAMTTAFSAADKAVQAALLSAKEAVTKAEVASEKRFESVNEFRAQLSDQASTFLSRTEAEIRFLAITEKGDLVASGHSTQLSDIQRRLDLSQGKAVGLNTGWTILIAAVGLILAVVGIVAFFNA